MIVLLIGGTGFLGSHLSEELIRNGVTVRTAARRNATYTVDVTRPATLIPAMTGVDVVVNLVALSPVRGYRRQHYWAVNHRGACNVAKAAAELGVPRLVHLSALGVTTTNRAPYSRSKARAVRDITQEPRRFSVPPQVTVVEPALLLGAGGQIETMLKRITAVAARVPIPIPVPLPRIPVLMQPVQVTEAARRIAQLIGTSGEKSPKVQRVELGGSRVLAISDIPAEFLRSQGVRTVWLPRWITPMLLYIVSRIPLYGMPRHIDDLLKLRNVVAQEGGI